jgi:hypothetical protein
MPVLVNPQLEPQSLVCVFDPHSNRRVEPISLVRQGLSCLRGVNLKLRHACQN